jgi:glycosyltransferase involved in cell wall biosynthesis
VANEPLVSILTPSFNQARWLVDTLQSVARQTYPHIEHIVMDGGSTDGTVDLLTHAGSRVTWKSEPDRGQSHALNKALAASTGEIIGWINSDDAYYDVDAVAAVAQCFARHPEVDVVYGHAA